MVMPSPLNKGTQVQNYRSVLLTGNVKVVPAKSSLLEGNDDKQKPNQQKLEWKLGKKMKNLRVKKRVHLGQTLVAYHIPGIIIDMYWYTCQIYS